MRRLLFTFVPVVAALVVMIFLFQDEATHDLALLLALIVLVRIFYIVLRMDVRCNSAERVLEWYLPRNKVLWRWDIANFTCWHWVGPLDYLRPKMFLSIYYSVGFATWLGYFRCKGRYLRIRRRKGPFLLLMPKNPQAVIEGIESLGVHRCDSD